MLLHGTDFQKPSYREKFKIKGKFRIVPLNFGSYDGKKVFDYEEVAIQTKDMSFDDYKQLRGLSLIVETIHNGRPFEEFFRFALTFGISRSRFILYIFNSIKNSGSKILSIFNDFLRETETELWENENDMIKFYTNEKN